MLHTSHNYHGHGSPLLSFTVPVARGGERLLGGWEAKELWCRTVILLKMFPRREAFGAGGIRPKAVGAVGLSAHGSPLNVIVNLNECDYYNC